MFRAFCFGLLGLTLSLMGFSLMGCRSPVQMGVPVQRWQGAYRPALPDERAILNIRLATVLDEVKAQAYPKLYGTWVLPQAPPSKQRSRFIQSMHCADTTLGPLQTYNTESVLMLKDETQHPQQVYVVNIVSTRAKAPRLEEQLHFMQQGLGFRLRGYFIKADAPEFWACMQRVSQAPWRHASVLNSDASDAKSTKSD